MPHSPYCLLLLHTLTFSCLWKVVSCDFDFLQPINGTFLQKVFEELIHPQDPINIFLDDQETIIEPAIRPILISMDHAGGVIYGYNPNLREKDIKLGTSGATDTVSFQWTYICIIEERKSKQNAANYLQALLKSGHGLNDRFILLGFNSNLVPFIRVPVGKFKNIIAVAIDQYENKVYQRMVATNKLTKLTEEQIENLRWLELGTMSGLSGQHFQISGTKFPPYLDIFYETDDDNSSLLGKKLMGVNYQIFHQGSKVYNYTYEFDPPAKWKGAGTLLPNGSWDGIFAELIGGKTDIASVSTQTEKRNDYADFVGPFGRARLVFVTALPQNFLGKYAIFRSYTRDVWLVVLLYFVILVGLLCRALMNSLLADNSTHYGGSKKAPEFLQIFSNAWFIVWGISFEQSIERSSLGIKMVMMLWVYLILVVGTGFKSNLAAKISFPQAEFRPTTFQELAKAKEYKIYFDSYRSDDSYTYFEEATTNPVLHNIFVRATWISNSTQCVISAFVEPKTVCIGWEHTLKIAIAQSLTVPQIKNPVNFAKEPAWTVWYTFALAKNSRFVHAFQKIGQHFFETGLSEFYRKRLVQNYRVYGLQWTSLNQNTAEFKKLMKLRDESGLTEKKPFKVANFQLIFILWFVGLAMSSGWFLWEIYSHTRETAKASEVGKKRMQIHRISLQPTGEGTRETPVFEIQHEVIPVEFVP